MVDTSQGLDPRVGVSLRSEELNPQNLVQNRESFCPLSDDSGKMGPTVAWQMVKHVRQVCQQQLARQQPGVPR